MLITLHVALWTLPLRFFKWILLEVKKQILGNHRVLAKKTRLVTQLVLWMNAVSSPHGICSRCLKSSFLAIVAQKWLLYYASMLEFIGPTHSDCSYHLYHFPEDIILSKSDLWNVITNLGFQVLSGGYRNQGEHCHLRIQRYLWRTWRWDESF